MSDQFDSLFDTPSAHPYPTFVRVSDDVTGPAWEFEVGRTTFRAVSRPAQPRGREWALLRQSEAGGWFTAYVDLPSREAALVEAESIVEIEEKAAAR